MVSGYFLAYGAQALWRILHGNPELAGDAIGEFGRGLTDAIAVILRH